MTLRRAHGGQSVRFCAAAFLAFTDALYLPGVAPTDFSEGDDVSVKVNKLTSVNTQIPFGYYTLPFCTPAEGILTRVENLGEILAGDLVQNSAYKAQMLVELTCEELCKVNLSASQKRNLRWMIRAKYLVHLLVDQLPAMTAVPRNADDQHAASQSMQNGFPVGYVDGSRYFINNHVQLNIYHHTSEAGSFRVVGVEAQPASFERDAHEVACTKTEGHQLFGPLSTVLFTYGVHWIPSDYRWASRWDNYLHLSDSSADEVHWYAIINALLVVFFFAIMVAAILHRTLCRDIAAYNELASKEEQLEETGWKLCHGDVFRAPRHAKLLVVSVGCGTQLLGMSLVTLLFALLGFLSPARRGALLQAVMLFFTFMGGLGGYTATRLYKIFDSRGWATVTLMTAFLYPGVIFSIFVVIDLVLWSQGSSGAVSFTTMLAIIVLWFGVSVPLVWLGSHYAHRKETIELPVRVNLMPRAIPASKWYQRTFVVSLLGGIFPFTAVFTELFFIMTSIWQHEVYYLFGFLTLVVCIGIVTCAEIAIAWVYMQLSSENYKWWWRAFLSSAMSGLYVFVYSIFYFNVQLHIDSVSSSVLYFGYMLMFSITFSLMAGAVGLLSSFWFVRGIYGSLKID